MTCIIGLVHNGNVYIGGDSAGVSVLSISTRLDEKVFINGPFIIGFTSSFRMGQLLRYKFNPPKQTTNCDDMKYMVTDFIDSVRKLFLDNGYGKVDNGGNFLIGYNKVLYNIDTDFQVGIVSTPYDSVGCGADIALGAMYATKSKKPEYRIKLALEAASTFNAGVRGPFIILKKGFENAKKIGKTKRK